jgi:hypothetical protein
MNTKEQPGFVYFIQQNGEGCLVKIGWTVDVFGRLRTLQTASPLNLQVLLAMSGAKSLEAALHLRFRQYHVEREWFRPAPELMLYIIANSLTEEQRYADSKRQRGGLVG